VSPLVIVPKKMDDDKNLNKATKKDHFPLPFIDHILDALIGNKLFSFLDGFSGYNQIQISPKIQHNATFTYPWGTFSYNILPFNLYNALPPSRR